MRSITTCLSVLTLTAAVGCAGDRSIDEFPATVGIVLHPGYFVSEVSAPLDMYKHAGEDLDVFLVAETMDPVVGYYGEIITPDYTFDDAPDLDVLVVPSGGGSMDVDQENRNLISYIRRQARKAAFVTSHCWGAFLLGAAGVLEGRAATTFPGYTDELAAQNPDAATIVTDERWVQDEHVITSNGGMAAYEASMAVIEQIFGSEKGDAVASGLVFDAENIAYARDPAIVSVPTTSAAIEADDEPKNVAILIMDGLFINEAVAPYDIYAHAGMNVYFVAETMDPIVGYYDEVMTPHYTFADAPQADILVIPSGGHSMDSDLENAALMSWVETQAAGAEWITSHCWGAFTLSGAGLTAGRHITTFPGYFEDLSSMFPSIGEVVETHRIVRDGNLVTSNGGLAAYEASLYVVEQIMGSVAGDVIAQGLVFADANLENVRSPYVRAE
jgi:transcriptional regulator GlxA family with amidase domain